jgi:hypothetical protein
MACKSSGAFSIFKVLEQKWMNNDHTSFVHYGISPQDKESEAVQTRGWLQAIEMDFVAHKAIKIK